jgi:DNA-binding transcriptional LysR family regulator
VDQLTVLNSFVRVVETGSFLKAARSLGVGQPAISKAIATLEARLTVRLLLRSTRRLTPTDAGSAFYECAKRITLEVERAEFIARQSNTELSGRILVSVDAAFARIHVMPRLRHFLEKHPNISLDIVLDESNVDLLEHCIDVALRVGTLDTSNLIAWKIGETRLVVVGSPSYFERFGMPYAPYDLTSHQFITYSQRGGGRDWVFRRSGAPDLSISLSGRIAISAIEGVREAVHSGSGFAIAPECMFSPELKSDLVSSPLNDWRLPASELWAVIPAGRMMAAKTRAFISFVEESQGLATQREQTPTARSSQPITRSTESASSESAIAH